MMRKLIAALLAGLLASSTVVFADEVSGLTRTSVEKAIHDHSYSDRQQAADAQQTTDESKPWVERHPVWSGLIAGAGVGAVWGASSCRKGCLYGPGGAAMIGSWFGAGPGALIGWAVGRAK